MHVIELSREMSQAWLGKSFVSSPAVYSLLQAVNDHLLFIKIQHQEGKEKAVNNTYKHFK